MLPLVYHPGYVAPLPEGHRFPMPKFALIYEFLREQGIGENGWTHTPQPATPEALRLVHTAAYLDAFTEGGLPDRAIRRIGLPWSEELVRRTVRAVGGTILTARLALRYGVAANSAGGTHHAHPDFGSGFCILNDLAVTAALLREEGAVRRVLIVDLDVHQGDGTAVALAGRKELYTFSMHCGSNFPFRKARSDFDLPLPDHLGDEGYLSLLERHLPELIDRVAPDLILYDAGVDVFRGDRLGRLDLTLDGIERRDRFVLSHAVERGIPIAAVIGGGYDRDLHALSRRHATVHRTAAAAVRRRPTDR